VRTTVPVVPTVDDLAADVITHHYDDMIAPPGLTNFLGTTVVGHDLTGLRAVTFPPVSQGSATTAALFVDGRLFESLGIPIAHAWRPDRVVRRATLGDLELETITVVVPGETAVAVDIRVTNGGPDARTVELALSLGARVTRSATAWTDAEMPSAFNSVDLDPARSALAFSDEAGGAWSIQGVDVHGTVRGSGVAPMADEFEVGIGGMGRGGEVSFRLDVAAGGSARAGYVHAVAADRATAEAVFDRVAADISGAVAAAEAFWNRELAAMFGGEPYRGALPVLETTNDALRRLYWWGAFGTVWFRREFDGNVQGRSYDTLMPNYWSTASFIWDYSLSGIVHALLDPDEMRAQLLAWIEKDIHRMFGTSSLTGEAIGRWYSVNDYAMTRLVTDYVRFTGDEAFLDVVVAAADGEAVPIIEHLVDWATAWQGLRRGSALADYGEIDNLLECVSTYTHEVASLNAANVWCLRTVAGLLESRGDDRAAELRAEADRLLPAVLDLYLPGRGFFAAGQPDGTRLPVRHCYDFNIVGTTIADSLADSVKTEMVEFFQRELQTENWMRALSPWDPDASYSIRPDHQWNGAYPAWPADAGRALVALGAGEVAADWVTGLARSTNQGPTGQAHFVEEAWPAINGGARKAPPQLPYINDWSCSSSGSWVQFVIEGLFGLTTGAEPTAGGPVGRLDPDAVLRGVIVGGRRYDVHADGRVEPSAG
jgi:hypothetical protein